MSARTSRVETEIEAIGAAEAAAEAPAAAAAVKSQGNTVDPPFLQQCFQTGCIQEKKAEATTYPLLVIPSPMCLACNIDPREAGATAICVLCMHRCSARWCVFLSRH